MNINMDRYLNEDFVGGDFYFVKDEEGTLDEVIQVRQKVYIIIVIIKVSV